MVYMNKELCIRRKRLIRRPKLRWNDQRLQWIDKRQGREIKTCLCNHCCIGKSLSVMYSKGELVA
jgi:hypothetical protein